MKLKTHISYETQIDVKIVSWCLVRLRCLFALLSPSWDVD